MDAEALEKEPEMAKGSAADEIVDIIKTIFYALLIALVLRVLLFQPFTIPSGSMIPNLLVGDYLIVSKYSYGYSRHSIPFSPPIIKGRIMGQEPAPGDVVVFKWPGDDRTDFIKRMIGLPGDRIQMRDGQLFINDKPLAQKLVGRDAEDVAQIAETNLRDRTYMTQDIVPRGPGDRTDVFVVPEGMYFVMGDNRDNSMDSRFPMVAGGVGFVPKENLVGRARVILFSWREGASLFLPWTWFTHARWDRFFHPIK